MERAQRRRQIHSVALQTEQAAAAALNHPAFLLQQRSSLAVSLSSSLPAQGQGWAEKPVKSLRSWQYLFSLLPCSSSGTRQDRLQWWALIRGTSVFREILLFVFRCREAWA
jgi:hypothetical protein